MIRSGNLFSDVGAKGFGGEYFEDIFSASVGGELRLSRIVSRNVLSGEVYEQSEDEFVVVLAGRGEVCFSDSGERIAMECGDWLYIPAGVKHFVVETSVEPACVWLAIFFSRDGDI